MRALDYDAGQLQKHIAATYFALRMGMGVLAAALPPLLWLGGHFADGEPLRASMSAYYYSPSMRDTFVGVLVAIGVFLYLYKGFSRQENWALNLAGALAIGIAMVPTSPCCAGHGTTVTPHGIFAALFFLTIAYVCLCRASDTLSLVRDTRKAKRLRAIYRVLGIAMVVSPAVAFALTVALRPGEGGRSLVFFVEAFAVWTFAVYWLTKSREMSETNAERLALERKLQRAAGPGPAGDRTPGRIVQIEPE
jgi:hypothetical protein